MLASNNPIAASYDLLAVQPLSERVFAQACTSLDVDIISLDVTKRLAFRLKPASIKSAVDRGIHFEVSVGPHQAWNVNALQLIIHFLLLLPSYRSGSGPPSVAPKPGERSF